MDFDSHSTMIVWWFHVKIHKNQIKIVKICLKILFQLIWRKFLSLSQNHSESKFFISSGQNKASQNYEIKFHFGRNFCREITITQPPKKDDQLKLQILIKFRGVGSVVLPKSRARDLLKGTFRIKINKKKNWCNLGKPRILNSTKNVEPHSELKHEKKFNQKQWAAQ